MFSFEDLVSGVEGAISDVADAVSEAAEDIYDTVSGAVEDVYETVSEAAEDVYDTVSEAAEDVYDTVSDAADNVCNNCETIEDVYDTVSEAAEDVYDTVSEGAEDVYDTVSEAESEVTDAVLGAKSVVADACEDWANDAEEFFEENYKAVVGAFIAPVDKSLNSFQEIGSDFLDSIKERTDKRYDSKYDFCNWLLIGIPGAAKSVLESNKESGEKALNSGSVYDYSNWLTMGSVDMVKGAFNPKDPLSKEHWENSFGVVSTLFGSRGFQAGLENGIIKSEEKVIVSNSMEPVWENEIGETAKWVREASPYSNLEDSASVGSGKNFTPAQKSKILQENRNRNGGVVKSDLSGQELVKPSKSQKGITPPQNEWQIDHIKPKDDGGSNSYSNAQVLSRKENRDKWDK